VVIVPGSSIPIKFSFALFLLLARKLILKGFIYCALLDEIFEGFTIPELSDNKSIIDYYKEINAPDILDMLHKMYVNIARIVKYNNTKILIRFIVSYLCLSAGIFLIGYVLSLFLTAPIGNLVEPLYSSTFILIDMVIYTMFIIMGKRVITRRA